MSIYRQLWLAIVISMLLALFGSLLASLLSARAYLQEQLAMKNNDNATVLALALSQDKPDPVKVELAVAAIFDGGHYESIRVIDPDGKTMIERLAPAGELGAPEWFVAKLPIAAEPGQAQISSGWVQFGTIVLASHSRFAYQALWQSTKEMVLALTLAGIVGGYLGSLVLRRLRGPLNAVVRQAEAIANRRFATIPEPEVPELRKLAHAMNTTVVRLKAMFEEEAARLDSVRREVNCDPLTGLSNREFFMSRLRSSLESEASSGGALLLIRVARLADINKRLGRVATDDFLKRLAQAIASLPELDAEGSAARMNGADFAVLLPGSAPASEVAGRLLDQMVKAGEPFVGSGPTAHIGVALFRPGSEVGALLAQVDMALAAAESSGENCVREAPAQADEEVPRTSEQWSALIKKALEQQWVRLISFPVVTMQGKLIHGECPLRLMFDANSEWLPAGRFLPMADRLGLTPALDLAAVSLGLVDLEKDPTLPGLAINLSASSLSASEFVARLDALLVQHKAAASRLWVEVPEAGVHRDVDRFRDLCRVLKTHNCKVGVEHFGREFSQIGQLHDMGLDYIKVDGSFVRGLENNPGNQAFLKGLRSIAHTIDLLVIGEGVVSEAELVALADVGFDGVTGPAVRLAA